MSELRYYSLVLTLIMTLDLGQNPINDNSAFSTSALACPSVWILILNVPVKWSANTLQVPYPTRHTIRPISWNTTCHISISVYYILHTVGSISWNTTCHISISVYYILHTIGSISWNTTCHISISVYYILHTIGPISWNTTCHISISVYYILLIH